MPARKRGGWKGKEREGWCGLQVCKIQEQFEGLIYLPAIFFFSSFFPPVLCLSSFTLSPSFFFFFYFSFPFSIFGILLFL